MTHPRIPNGWVDLGEPGNHFAKSVENHTNDDNLYRRPLAR